MRKGWGLRCLDPLPPYTYVCSYAGEVLSNETAEIQGRETGDSYLVDLDFLEVWGGKPGYEAEVRSPGPLVATQTNGACEVTVKKEKEEEDGDTTPLIPIEDEAGNGAATPLIPVENTEVDGDTTPLIQVEDADVEATPLIPVPWGDWSLPADWDLAEYLRKVDSAQKIREESAAGQGHNSVPIKKEKQAEPFSTRRYYGDEEPHVVNAHRCGSVGRFINVRSS